jgi:hypothetical protein
MQMTCAEPDVKLTKEPRILNREIVGVDVSGRTLVHLPEQSLIHVIGPESGSPSLVRVQFGSVAVKVFSVDLYKRSIKSKQRR